MNSKKEQNKIIELQEVIIPEETSKRITALRFLLIVVSASRKSPLRDRLK